MEEQLELPYTVRLQVFEGPLDLLLHLIKKNEVDIYDIPIAKITEQYLEYLEFLDIVNLELVGDYLALAAELGYIKSRMLLPKIHDEDEEEDDPREELVRRLLEYERYKDAAEDLKDMDILGREIFTRGADQKEIFGEPLEETEYVKTDVWSLIDAFREILERKELSYKEDIFFTVETLSVEERSEKLLEIIKTKNEILFRDLFKDDKSKPELVVTFLSVLELTKNGIIGIVINEQPEDIKIIYLGEQ